MREEFSTSDGQRSKAECVAEVINRSLQTLVSKCTKSESIHDYYQVGVIGYNGQGVKSALSGSLANKNLVPISLIGNYPTRIEKRIKQIRDSKGAIIEKRFNQPVWVEPTAIGGTPMKEAFNVGFKVIEQWLAQHPSCYPPVVINVTDGESSDGDPEAIANKLTKLKSTDGNVLLFNLHISSLSTRTLEYPHKLEEIKDDFAKELFKISSPLTSYMVKVLSDEGYPTKPGARGFVFNADFQALLRFIDIGTRPKAVQLKDDHMLNQIFNS
jgi:uncharacterized protein YegL